MAKHADSHAPKHPYHLVNPSPWPMAISFALLFLTGGGVLTMHNVDHGGVVLFLGLVSTLGVSYAWWRDVIREGIHDKAHNETVKTGLRFGMLLFIVSEIMFFAAFFWAFFWASLDPFLPLDGVWPAIKDGVWPPASITTLDAWDLPLINTLILLLSGTTVTWAHHALLQGRNDEVKTALLITVLLGLSFTGLQALEYSHATFAFKDGIYPSTFYMATGFHGFHVIIGTLFLAVALIRAHRGTLTPKGHLGFEFAAWYWHFVDAVWLFLFVCVYWWGKLSEYNDEELTAAETLSVLKTGFAGRCPRCGEGKLLKGLLAYQSACSHCGMSFANSEKGDGPAFFAISIVGTLAAIGAVLTEVFFQPPYWVHAALWLPISIIGSLLVLRWSKGIIIAMQYKHQQEAFLDE